MRARTGAVQPDRAFDHAVHEPARDGELRVGLEEKQRVEVPYGERQRQRRGRSVKSR